MSRSSGRGRGDRDAVGEGERLQSFLARAGLGSRRAMDAAIAEGRVRVDRQLATPGTRVHGGERVEFDGRSVSLPRRAAARVLVYHKPAGEACVAAPMDLVASVDRLPPSRAGRWQPMTRLDFNAAGLVLFGNDGALADAVLRRISSLDAEFIVRVRGTIADPALAALREYTSEADGGRPLTVVSVDAVGGEGGSHHWYRVVLRGGRDRDARALFEAHHVEVSRIKHVRVGPLLLPRLLTVGHSAEVLAAEWRTFTDALGLTAAATEAVPAAGRRSRPGSGAGHRRAQPEGDARGRDGAGGRASARPSRQRHESSGDGGTFKPRAGPPRRR